MEERWRQPFSPEKNDVEQISWTNVVMVLLNRQLKLENRLILRHRNVVMERFSDGVMIWGS
jgi:hypothetical protein